MKTQTTSAKYNKSEIFKAAWSLVKTAGKTISEALKTAWNAVKNPVKKSVVEIAEEIIADASYEVSVWENYGKRRLYINRPSESKKYQSVGYIDLTSFKAVCGVHESRTSRGREYAEILNNVLVAIQ